MKQLLSFWLVFIFIHSGLPAGNQFCSTSLPSTGSLAFYSDICQYQALASLTLVEISYAVGLNQFISDSDTGKKEINLLVQLNLLPAAPDSVIRISEHRKFMAGRDNISDTYLDLKQFRLKPGNWNYELTISDSASGLKGWLTHGLEVRSFPASLSLSDLAFISHVQKSNQTGPGVFQKNGLALIPNPSRVFYKSGTPGLFYIYYEINNMSFDPAQASFYDVQCNVSDMSGNSVWNYAKEGLAKSSANSARVEKIPLADFKAGMYKLNVTVMDINTGQVGVSAAYFSVYNNPLEAKLVLPMSDQDAERYYQQIRYIATARELDLFRQLDAYGKQQFLISFWKTRDPDPKTPQNEFMEQHFSRLAYCEQAFKGGINSDMGRIYITYGPPLEKIRQPSIAVSVQAVETWIYPINGRTEFVFVDRSGYGQYVLVHSTHPNEYHNENWLQEVEGAAVMDQR